MGPRAAHIVSVSGGKDSTATYCRAVERGRPFRAVAADTGNEHPATYEAVNRLSERTGGPVVEWAKTDRGGRQYPLFGREPSFACNQWGACE